VNLHLQRLLEACGVAFERVPKGEKLRWLSRWNRAFPRLATTADFGDAPLRGPDAQEAARGAPAERFYVLPDDASAMPAYACSADRLPDLELLVSDEVTTCQEIVLLDAELRWAYVLTNGGSPELVGARFSWRGDGV
jgi:hypothetical protein